MTQTIGRNRPITATCPHCNNAQAQLLPPVGDSDDYKCPTCGEFSLSGTTQRLVELGMVDIKTARFVIGVEGKRFLGGGEE